MVARASAGLAKRLGAANHNVAGHVFDRSRGLVIPIGSVHRRRGVSHQTVALRLRLSSQERRRLFAVDLFDLLYDLLHAQRRATTTGSSAGGVVHLATIIVVCQHKQQNCTRRITLLYVKMKA